MENKNPNKERALLKQQIENGEFEENHEDKEEILKPKTFKEKVENFFYHYKFQFFAGVFAVFFLAVMLTQMLGRDKFDYVIMYAGPKVLISDESLMTQSLTMLAQDVDGNGEINISINDIVILSPEEQQQAKEAGSEINPENYSEAMQNYEAQLLAGDSYICLLSPYMYEQGHDSGRFCELSDIFGKNIPESAYDNCAILLSDTDFSLMPGFENLPDDTLLCMKKLSEVSDSDSKHIFNASEMLFKKIVKYVDAPADAE